MNRVMICGSNGSVGQRLALMLGEQTRYEVLNTSRSRDFVFNRRLYDYTQLDLTRRSDVKSLVASFQPDVVINAAGAASPDWCELNREEAWRINVAGVENLAEACRRADAKLIHISTDYVFDGRQRQPYTETDRTDPVNYYGKSKLAAENAIFSAHVRSVIVRTNVLYGALGGPSLNLGLKIFSELRAGRTFYGSTDQFCNPTAVADLTNALITCARSDVTGLFHIAGSRLLSRYEFARMIVELFRLDPALLVPVTSAQLGQKAVRPPHVELSYALAQKTFGYEPTDTVQSLLCMKQELEMGISN